MYNSPPPRVAFLGPPGSYSHSVSGAERMPSALHLILTITTIIQCAVERFDDSVQYIEQPTIAGISSTSSHTPTSVHIALDVFRALSPEIPFAVLPQENSVYGTVVDTYDALRSPEAGKSVFIRGELATAIQHCLIVRRGVKLEDIQRVMSHEQAYRPTFIAARNPD